MDEQTRERLGQATAQAKAAYAAALSGTEPQLPWWDVVVVTASSARQAERYETEIRQRQAQGWIPAGTTALVVPDLDDQRLGSGGATLNALRVVAAQWRQEGAGGSLEDWWATRRVLVLHSGGDSRRLPQYSLSGKLFSVLPVTTPWGQPSTVFDEVLALSTPWAAQCAGGLVVGSGDVILSLDASELDWSRPGVSGVAMRQPVAVGTRHGVYITDAAGRVYRFLQKPTAAQVEAAGGLVAPEVLALDSGLMYFDPRLTARLSRIAGVDDSRDVWTVGEGVLAATAGRRPELDLYEHFTFALTGQWVPEASEGVAAQALADVLHGVPFHCSLVEGEFTHVGTTRLFREIITEETNFLRLYESPQRLAALTTPGVHGPGVVLDSVLAAGGDVGGGAVVLECHLEAFLRVRPGAIAHGLMDLTGPVEVPEDTVLHQVPVALGDGTRGTVLRVYGVADDPKDTLTSGRATWLNRPLGEMLEALGLAPEAIWGPTLPPEGRSLWNASLFPVTDPNAAWACARWFLGLDSDFTVADWAALPRLSLADSAQCADLAALADTRARRLEGQWVATALALAADGADVRPLLAFAPGLPPVSAAGRVLVATAEQRLAADEPSAAASSFFQGHLFLARAGLQPEAEAARERAYGAVRKAVEAGSYPDLFADLRREWAHPQLQVAAPARVDLGGGWSDTPPFCLDWGGAVLNLALKVDGRRPIVTHVRRLSEPLIRCISGDRGETAEYRTAAEVLQAPEPGCPFAVPRAALNMTGLVRSDDDLPRLLQRMGGGLEIRTEVALPMGSGLGTSSILAATLLQGLAVMLGRPLEPQELNEQVMALEQFMTTGGGWQDQAGAIFPGGAKLLTSAPGPQQRLRCTPVPWSPERQAEFASVFTLHFTGLQRIARNLLQQVVGRYLAREATATQVLHSIKTLALEMHYALAEGDWVELGRLLDRHWQLNQILDPNTTNAPIEALLAQCRPYLTGSKLAGAGGGGFLLLLSADAGQAQDLRASLQAPGSPGHTHEWSLCPEGVEVTIHD